MYVGELLAVTSLTLSLHKPNISLSWTAPFSLDIPNTDPDITYCVDVINSTSSTIIHSDCGITVTEYTYPIPLDNGCHDHAITVTPVNVAGNGQQETIFYSQALPGACYVYNHVVLLAICAIKTGVDVLE